MLDEKQLEELKDRLENSFSDYYEEAGGWEYRYHHLLRVRRYTVKLMQTEEVKQEEFDPKVAEVAALFHDIGRKEDIDDDHLDPMETHEGHDETGAEIVEEYVSDKLTDEQLKKVEKVIRDHHSEPETVETKIVQDADDIGLTGAMNLWRMIHYASDNERVLEETFDYFRNTAIEDLGERIEDMNFEVSKKVARERLENYRKTIDLMEREHLGEDI